MNPSETKQVRIGLVGLGGHGGTMQQACELASNIRVAAVYDPDKLEAEKAARQFDCYQAVSYEELIRREDVEAVALITPNHHHRKQVVAALDADLHVFVEKPIARSLDEGMEMISKAEAKGRVLMVGHNMRFWSTARMAKTWMLEGRLGQMISAEIHFSAATGLRMPLDSWRRKPELCPILPVTQLAIHAFDLIQYLVGYIEEVTTYTHSALTHDEVVDSVSAIFKMENGALGTMISNYCSPELFEIRFSGTGGQICLRPGSVKYSPLEGEQTGEQIEIHQDLDKGFGSYRQIIEAFGNAVIDQTLPETDGWVGLQALAVVEAMQRSAVSSATPWIVERFTSTSLTNKGVSEEVL